MASVLERFTGNGIDDGNAGPSAPVIDRLSQARQPWAAVSFAERRAPCAGKEVVAGAVA